MKTINRNSKLLYITETIRYKSLEEQNIDIAKKRKNKWMIVSHMGNIITFKKYRWKIGKKQER